MIIDDDLLELGKILSPVFNMEIEIEASRFYRDEKVYAKIKEIGIHKVLAYWLYASSINAMFIFFNFPRVWQSLTKEDFIELFNDFSKRERFDELFNLMKIVQGYLRLDVYDFIEENEIFRGKTLEKFYQFRYKMEDQFTVGDLIDVSGEMIEDVKILRKQYIEAGIFKALEIKSTSNTTKTDTQVPFLQQLFNRFKKLIDF